MPQVIMPDTQLHALGLRSERLHHLAKMLEKWQQEEIRQCMVVRVLRKGVTVFEGRYGKADDSDNPPLPSFDSIFQVASITKPFIATMLMQLQEDGELNMCDSVSDYIPSFLSEDKKEIAIAHLLAHTSGIVDDELHNDTRKYIEEELKITLPNRDDDDDDRTKWNEAMLKARNALDLTEDEYPNDNPWKLWEYISMNKVKITRKPRELMSYCNTGYNIAKQIITTVAKQPIEQVLRERIADPLGMPDTHFILPKEKYSRVIRRLPGWAGYPWYNEEGSYISEHGAGGLKTTANDITRFLEAFRNRGELDGVRILAPRSVDTMLKNHNYMLTKNQWDAWGLGWNISCGKYDDLSLLRPDTTVDHGGYGGTKIMLDRENALTLVFFTVDKDSSPYKNLQGLTSAILYSSLMD